MVMLRWMTDISPGSITVTVVPGISLMRSTHV